MEEERKSVSPPATSNQAQQLDERISKLRNAITALEETEAIRRCYILTLMEQGRDENDQEVKRMQSAVDQAVADRIFYEEQLSQENSTDQMVAQRLFEEEQQLLEEEKHAREQTVAQRQFETQLSLVEDQDDDNDESAIVPVSDVIRKMDMTKYALLCKSFQQ